ncbi:MAG: hypothetical protein PHG79_01720 [Methanosarcina sp.]|jgi:hypothetical protein|nr:hypothetical protein [Methanosarcina sp.]MDD3873928.1 hypothetical protein [Methanosarcina sp.]MDD4522398.1 hypothetical protein [Methanosarcina sp.]HHV25490.1 hypothetical protein [Methanosarcina sp.]
MLKIVKDGLIKIGKKPESGLEPEPGLDFSFQNHILMDEHHNFEEIKKGNSSLKTLGSEPT